MNALRMSIVGVASFVFFTGPLPALSQECTPPPTGVVACWKAEGTAADPVGGHDGTMTGDSSFGIGKSAGGFTFAGNGSVAIPSHPALQFNHLSIAAWIKPVLLDGHVDIILNKEAPPGTAIQYEFGIRGTDHAGEGTIPVGNLAFFLGGISGLPDNFQSWVDGWARIPLNSWSHVALTFDGAIASVFLDGVSTRTLTGLAGAVAITSGPLKIGARSDPIPGWMNTGFNGGIDEVALFNRALSQTEIQAIYEADSGGFCCEEPISVERTTWSAIKSLR
jgi:Concanavalin A-like lectin/glucanases superfamily